MIFRGIIYSLNRCGLRTGFVREGGKRVRCLRWGGEKSARYKGAPFPQIVPPAEDWAKAIVFAVGIYPGIIERWKFQRPFFYLVATSEDAAEKYLDGRFFKILKASAGLAKRTIGTGMSKVATASGTGRISAGNAKTRRVRQASNKYSDARVWINGAEFGVRMDSNLCYALDAVTGGSAAIDFAVRKAMNKVAGYINRYIGGDLDPSNRRLLTPFRDIVGKRSI